MSNEVISNSLVSDPAGQLGGEVDPTERLTPDDELLQLLQDDETRLGDVYRLHVVDGLTPREVADTLNIDSQGFVWGYRSSVEAISHGTIPSNPSFRKQSAGAIRNLLKKHGRALSDDARDLLNSRLAVIQRAVEADSQEAPDETQRQAEEFDLANLEGKQGIYAFSYGWYLEHPVNEERGTTLVKVGHSTNIGSRIRSHQQAIKTHLPEPLVVVRAYSTASEDSRRIEAVFHRLLKTAGHENPRYTPTRRREVGEEWFLTNEDFLDAIASALGLRTEFIGRSEFVDL